MGNKRGDDGSGDGPHVINHTGVLLRIPFGLKLGMDEPRRSKISKVGHSPVRHLVPRHICLQFRCLSLGGLESDLP